MPFDFLSTEPQLDAVLAEAPGLAFAANLAQTVRESDAARTELKRALCLVELHRAHRVDLRWADPRCAAELGGPAACRVFFDALDEAADEFLFGTRTHESFLELAARTARAIRAPPPWHAEARRAVAAHRAGALRGFDGEFARRLLRHLAVLEQQKGAAGGDAAVEEREAAALDRALDAHPAPALEAAQHA